MFGRYKEIIRKKRVVNRVNRIGKKTLTRYAEEQLRENEKITEDSPIWIFWWQGVEQAPEVVKKCMESIDLHKGQHVIKVITKDNINDYMTVPVNIMNKLEQGKITFTHFSDIVRMILLAQYGGIWMDPTLYVMKDMPAEIGQYSFYSCKTKPVDFFVSKCRWSAFFLAMSKGNVLARFCRDFFELYWDTYDELIDYYLVDEAIHYAYEHIKDVQRQIDELPFNNLKIHELQKVINEKWDKQQMDCLCENTWMFKLSWKKEYIREETFYHELFGKQ